jgi:D-glycero-D-manno-heptose 1,7-bisphosphate phosphatase
MHAHLRRLVPSLDLIQVCYHGGDTHDQPCDCRKPKPGMLTTAAAQLGLDLAKSWMIGDRWGDIDAGHAAGCRTVFIDHGYTERTPAIPPHFTAASFAQAAGIILAES